VVSGSASARTNNGQISGTIVFGGKLGVGGVGASQSFSQGFLAAVMVDTESNLDTGLALRGLVSFSPSGHLLSIELFQADGLLVARAELTVRALGHEARFLSEFEWVPEPGVELDFSRFEGLIKVRTKSPVTATVLQTRVRNSQRCQRFQSWIRDGNSAGSSGCARSIPESNLAGCRKVPAEPL